MNALTNPATVKLALLVGIVLVSICVIGGCLAVAKLRQGLNSESEFGSLSRPLLSPDTLAFATFQQTIKDLKQQQQALEEIAKRETLRANAAALLNQKLIEHLPIPAVVLNSVGIVQQANSGARDFFGFASLTGFGLKDLAGRFQSDSDQRQLIETLRNSLRSSEPLDRLSVTYTAPGGALIPTNITAVPQGNGNGILLFSAPVTRRGACTDEVLPPDETQCSTGTKRG